MVLIYFLDSPGLTLSNFAEYLVHILHHRLGNLFDDLSNLSLDHLHDPFLVGDLRHFDNAVNLGMEHPLEKKQHI